MVGIHFHRGEKKIPGSVKPVQGPKSKEDEVTHQIGDPAPPGRDTKARDSMGRGHAERKLPVGQVVAVERDWPVGRWVGTRRA